MRQFRNQRFCEKELLIHNLKTSFATVVEIYWPVKILRASTGLILKVVRFKQYAPDPSVLNSVFYIILFMVQFILTKQYECIKLFKTIFFFQYPTERKFYFCRPMSYKKGGFFSVNKFPQLHGKSSHGFSARGYAAYNPFVAKKISTANPKISGQ